MAILLPSGQIAEPSEQARGWPIMRMAFRPLFWLGALFSALSVPIWALSFTGNLPFNPLGGSYFWHVHEMLFGFAVAIITGFLLTAVQTWSGVPSVKGKPLALLVALWLSARLLLALPSTIPNAIIVTLDLAYLPLAALCLSLPIIKARLWRNLFFVPILLAMACLNALMYAARFNHLDMNFISISHIMVMMITLVMVIMGGRVFPMFTANGTQTPRVTNISWLDRTAIISVLACILLTISPQSLNDNVTGCVFIFAGVINFIRAVRWRIWVTFGCALVWPLHVSYWAICIGLVLLGLYYLALLSSVSMAYHAITVGGIGMMVLAMISRVSLGHTGRMIKVGPMMTVAFAIMLVTLVIRLLAPALSAYYQTFIMASALLWSIAYGCYVVRYAGIVFRPRIDGRDG
ncbi:NnrS family protein [Pseudoalteromonas sp. SSDWG2]|uniref:NnrS family protein n=1 Tax=Pseudoalteromonas sp. SSDWG2 TaxID=3139391 RepID=UPI003BA89371